MEKISDFSPYRLHNGEHYQYMTDFDGLVTKATVDVLGITEVYPPFKSAFAEEDKSMKVILGSIKSKEILEGDKLRDTTWNSINLRLKGTVICPVPDEVASAKVIKHILDGYGDIREDPFNEETGEMSNLLNDLLSTGTKSHLDKIGITTWVNALKTQNEAFIQLMNDRNIEYSVRSNGNVRRQRKVVDPLYKEIIDHINATIILKVAKPGVETFVTELNERIRYYENTLAIREGRADAADNENPPKDSSK